MSNRVQVKQHTRLALSLNFFIYFLFSFLFFLFTKNGTRLHFQERVVLLLAVSLRGPQILCILVCFMSSFAISINHIQSINLLFGLPWGLETSPSFDWYICYPSSVHVQKLFFRNIRKVRNGPTQKSDIIMFRDSRLQHRKLNQIMALYLMMLIIIKLRVCKKKKWQDE